MAISTQRRPWQLAEDKLLVNLVSRYGSRRGRPSESSWTNISSRLPGRTSKDCRKRWFYSLDPALRKGRWTAEEDETIKTAYQRQGPAWKEIAAMLNGRRDDQVAKRYNEVLSPSVSDRLTSWSAEEDRILTEQVTACGHRWATISAQLPGRPPLTCRNRWRTLRNRAQKRLGSAASDTDAHSATAQLSARSDGNQSSDLATTESCVTPASGTNESLDSHFIMSLPTHHAQPLTPIFAEDDGTSHPHPRSCSRECAPRRSGRRHASSSTVGYNDIALEHLTEDLVGRQDLLPLNMSAMGPNSDLSVFDAIIEDSSIRDDQLAGDLCDLDNSFPSAPYLNEWLMGATGSPNNTGAGSPLSATFPDSGSIFAGDAQNLSNTTLRLADAENVRSEPPMAGAQQPPISHVQGPGLWPSEDSATASTLSWAQNSIPANVHNFAEGGNQVQCHYHIHHYHHHYHHYSRSG